MWSSATICPFILLVLFFIVSVAPQETAEEQEMICSWQDEPNSAGARDQSTILSAPSGSNFVATISECKLQCEAKSNCVAIDYEFPTCRGYGELQNTVSSDGATYSIMTCQQKAVGFYARVYDNHEPYDDGSTLRFDNVITNKGDAYNPENGHFTVSIPGLYLFHFSLDACQLDKEIVLTGVLMVGNDMVARAQTGYRLKKAVIGSARATLFLKSGQKVRVQNHQDGSVYCKDYSTFSGVLIKSTAD